MKTTTSVVKGAPMRRLVYFVATSLDGFIASPQGSFDAFPMAGDHIEALFREFPETLPGPLLTAAGIAPSNATFDTVLMGWNTYDVGRRVGLASPYPHLRQYVFSRTHAASPSNASFVITSESPTDLVRKLKNEPGERDIWLCGGGRLASALESEVDRLVLKVNPVLLGSGIRLFEDQEYRPQSFRLESSRAFNSGVVMNVYSRA
jgi:dihydrofolate reductase